MGNEEVLASILDPLDRAAEADGSGGDCRILAIERALGTKAAADLRRYHAHLMVAIIQHVHERALEAVRALAGNISRQLAGDLIPTRRPGRGSQ